MRQRNKQSFRVFLPILFIAILLFLSGCSGRGDAGEGAKLWVVTEASCSDGMNLQARQIAQRMEEAHGELTVQLDILPTESTERAVVLQQLRTQILAGQGPDVYLFPTGDILTTDYPIEHTFPGTLRTQVELLFPDVEQAMRCGLFADLQGFYRLDQALDTGALQTAVMEAGVLEGCRYVLPLRFSMPVVFFDSQRANPDWTALDGVSLAATLLAREETAAFAVGVQLPGNLDLFPALFDYDAGTVLISAREIAEYMRVYQQWRSLAVPEEQALVETWQARAIQELDPLVRDLFAPTVPSYIYDIGNFNDLRRYIGNDMHWTTAGLPVYACSLGAALQTLAVAAVSEASGQDQGNVSMLPFRATDGSVVADVSYYGAVGSSCADPELAYAFLRQFLTEEFQWDGYRPQVEKRAASGRNVTEVQHYGLVEDSWPVRVAGSVPPLWATAQYQVRTVTSTERSEASWIARLVQTTAITDVPALGWEIDTVRFPVTLAEGESPAYALALLNAEDGAPTDADIDVLAQAVWDALWWHITEG